MAVKDGVKHYIQCKKFIKSVVKVSDVRDFYGALVDHLANGKGYLVTTNKFTNEINLLSPHPEARSAKVRILGKIRPGKKGFSPVNKEVKFIFSLKREAPTEPDSSYSDYLKSPSKFYGIQLKSWRNWFYVVKKNGWGNFHSLINLSNDWVVMILEKELSDRKEINIKNILKSLPATRARALTDILEQIGVAGDKVFKDKYLIMRLLRFDAKILVPVFIRMLNWQETGRHEACTFFAFLLKVAKNNKRLVIAEVDKAFRSKTAPNYYLQDLKNKLSAK